MPLDIVAGWTGNIDQQLKADGVNVDLTGMTLALILRDEDGVFISTTCSGEVTISSSTSGKVTYNPRSTDVLKNAKSPYQAHWKVTDATSKIVFFPSGKADTWTVHSQ